MSGRSFFTVFPHTKYVKKENIVFILDASEITGKISIGISRHFYYMFQLLLKLNMPLF